jgi:hypothetical protein
MSKLVRQDVGEEGLALSGGVDAAEGLIAIADQDVAELLDISQALQGRLSGVADQETAALLEQFRAASESLVSKSGELLDLVRREAGNAQAKIQDSRDSGLGDIQSSQKDALAILKDKEVGAVAEIERETAQVLSVLEARRAEAVQAISSHLTSIKQANRQKIAEIRAGLGV